MPLVLKVLTYQGHPPRELLSAIFDEDGGTIGRSAPTAPPSGKKHFTLHDPDQIVSGLHAEIYYENTRYYIADASTNGTFIRNKNIELFRQTAPLDDGDRLLIGDYEILVSIDLRPDAPRPEPPIPPAPGPEIPGQGSETNPLDFGDFFPSQNLHQQHSTGKPSTQGSPPPENTVASREGHRETIDRLLEVFLKTAGISDTASFSEEDPLELMETVGGMLRELVDGLMGLLSGRREIKRELQVKGTRLEPTENNPLKCDFKAEDALKLMLTKRHRAFLPATDAVRDGYMDIKNHQLAFAAGVQASLKRLLERFDPERFAQTHQNSLLLKNLKLWEAYCHEYGRMAKEAEDGFFGDEFSAAYDQQILELHAVNETRMGSGEEEPNV